MKSVDKFMEENLARYSSLHISGSSRPDLSERRNNRKHISAADPDEFGDVYGIEEKDEDLKMDVTHGAKPGWRRLEFKQGAMKGRG